MAYVKIWVHVVWATKNRDPVLEKEFRPKLFQHIRENAKSKSIFIDFINGYTEHVHCLIGLNADQSISKAVQLLKGESSFWANRSGLINNSLQWGDEYFATSVSESMREKVRNYIKNQEEHHRTVPFAEEYQMFIKKYGFGGQG